MMLTGRARPAGESPRGIHPVAQALDARLLGAVVAAVEVAVRLEAVPEDTDAAVRARRRERVRRALEAVEHVPLPRHRHLERLVVVVPADFAPGHGNLLAPLHSRSVPGTLLGRHVTGPRGFTAEAQRGNGVL